MIKIKEKLRTNEYQNYDILIAIMLSLFVLFSRIIFAEQFFLGYDPINFAMGSISFSLANTRPHLPGYYLFVKSIQFIGQIFNDRHTASLIVNFLFTFAASFFSYLCFRKLFDTKISILVLLLLAFNPMVWYYGCVTEIYVFDWFLSAVLLFVYFQKNGWYFVFPIIALGTGFRQSSGVLLLPFCLYILFLHFKKRDIKYKYLLLSLFASVLLFFTWFIPMISNAGGLSGYIALYSENNPVEKISLLQNWFRMSSLMFFFAAPLIFLLITILTKLRNIKLKVKKIVYLKLFAAIFVFPMLFFVFVHYSKGYLLLIVLPVFASIGILIEEKFLSKVLIIITILIESMLFLFGPYHQETITSIIRPQIRRSSITSLWLDRTFSNYSLTKAGISGESDKVAKLKQIVEISNTDTIFIDPTLSHYARILQYYFPSKNFLTIYLHDTNKVILFNKLKVLSIDKKDINWRNVLILTRNDFMRSYLKNNKLKIIESNSNFSLIKISNDSNFIDMYEKLFSRAY